MLSTSYVSFSSGPASSAGGEEEERSDLPAHGIPGPVTAMGISRGELDRIPALRGLGLGGSLAAASGLSLDYGGDCGSSSSSSRSSIARTDSVWDDISLCCGSQDGAEARDDCGEDGPGPGGWGGDHLRAMRAPRSVAGHCGDDDDSSVAASAGGGSIMSAHATASLRGLAFLDLTGDAVVLAPSGVGTGTDPAGYVPGRRDAVTQMDQGQKQEQELELEMEEKTAPVSVQTVLGMPAVADLDRVALLRFQFWRERKRWRRENCRLREKVRDARLMARGEATEEEYENEAEI